MELSIKKTLFNYCATIFKGGFGIFGKKNSKRILIMLSEQLQIIQATKTDLGIIKYYCPGLIALWRAETMLTKEPETIQWINNFQPGSVFWDIGANVGNYSMYAALVDRVNVIAFEPSASNYYLLNKNIEINGLTDKINSLCLAFNDTTCLDKLFLSNSEIGSAHCNLSEAKFRPGIHATSQFKQGMIAFTIDEFVEKFNPLFPNYLKIDVDGIEDKILMGAVKTLSDKRLKSLLVELDCNNEKHLKKIIPLIQDSGLTLFKKEKSPLTKIETVAEYNHIFIRPK